MSGRYIRLEEHARAIHKAIQHVCANNGLVRTSGGRRAGHVDAAKHVLAVYYND